MNPYEYLTSDNNNQYKCKFISGHIVFTKEATILKRLIKEELSFEELKGKFSNIARIVFPNQKKSNANV